MAYLLNKKSKAELVDSAVKDIVNMTQLTEVMPNSTLDAMVRAFSNRLAEFYDTLELAFRMTKLSEATGPYLDDIAADRGVERQIFTVTNVPCETDTLILRTVDGGTLYSALNISETQPYAVLPKGMIVTSSSNSQAVMRLDKSRIIGPRDVRVSLGISGELESGEVLNSGTLDTIDWSQAPQFSATTANLEVIQSKTIIGIEEVENDESLAYRVTTHLETAVAGNQEAITSAIQSHPEVAQVLMHRKARGTGSYDLVVFPSRNRISEAVLKQFENAVAPVASFGEDFRVVAPNYIPLSLTILSEFRVDVVDAIENFVEDLSNKDISYEILSSYLFNRGIRADIQRITVSYRDLLPGATITLLPTEMFELRPRIESEKAVEVV